MILYLGLVWMWKGTVETYLMFPGYVDRLRKNAIFITGKMTFIWPERLARECNADSWLSVLF